MVFREGRSLNTLSCESMKVCVLAIWRHVNVVASYERSATRTSRAASFYNDRKKKAKVKQIENVCYKAKKNT